MKSKAFAKTEKNSGNAALGEAGETKAVEYLKRHGYRVLERNYRCRFGEIDIIAVDCSAQQLCFIEVKTRSDLRKGRPCEAVTPAKIQHIRRTAYHYLSHSEAVYRKYRIDVAEIIFAEGRYYLRYTKNV